MKQPEAIIEWSTPEYEYREKGGDWYWALGIITLSTAAASIMLANILFGIFILIGGFTLALYGKRRPNTIQVQIRKRGIVIDKTLHPFGSLASFWVEEKDDPKLILASEKIFYPYIVIPLGDADPEEVRDILVEVLDEEMHEEPVTQKIMERLGF